MKLLMLALLALPLAAETGTQKRVTSLEKRMGKVEKRVSSLEKKPAGAVPAAGQAAAAVVSPDQVPAIPKNPIAVYVLKKRQYVSKEKMGVTLSVEFENLARRKFYAFSGDLEFKDETGAGVWKMPYAYSEPIAAGERVKTDIEIPGLQAKEYLKFMKARELSATFSNQEYYAAD